MSLTKKQKVAALSVTSNTALILLKTVAGIMSGSISIISEAIHSGMDLVAAIIAYISVSLSGKPADKGHPYGHGKIENISAFIEGLLIFVAAALIIKEALHKLLNPTPLNETNVGIMVMLFSGIVNSIVAYMLYKTAKEEDSIALEADALHLKTDVYTSVGVAVGLILIKITGIYLLDPIVALLVTILIIKESWHLCSVAFGPLLDRRLEDEEEQPILMVLEECKKREQVEIGFFKTRRSGALKFIDFHVYMNSNTSLEDMCLVSERIRSSIQQVCPQAHIHINIESMEKYSSTAAINV